MKLLI
jgi:hypothetical protein